VKFESVSKIEINGKERIAEKKRGEKDFMKFWHWSLQLTLQAPVKCQASNFSLQYHHFFKQTGRENKGNDH